MPRHRTVLSVLLAGCLPLAAVAGAGEFNFQNNFGSTFFSASPPCPVKRFPPFESIVPIPRSVDPFEADLVPVFCDIQISREGQGVKKAKADITSQLVVIDNNTGMAVTHDLGSRKLKTDSNGRDGVDFMIPASIFADGFESGDVSAWSYSRTDFSNRKKATNASMNCRVGGSTSDN